MNARLELVPLAAQAVMPWANGGGTTRQVAIEPAGATAATCHWRVSIAQVGSDGPFSQLPGIDRSLWLLRGAGVRLDVNGCTVVLDRPRQRFDFAGETPIHATLLAGPCEDLNVMTARAWGRADAQVVELAAGSRLELAAAADRLVVVLTGDVHAASVVAREGDALRVRGDDALTLVAPRGACALVAGFMPRAR